MVQSDVVVVVQSGAFVVVQSGAVVVGLLTQKEVPEFTGVGEDLDDAVHEAGVAQVVQAREARLHHRHIHLLLVQRLYLGCWFLCKNMRQKLHRQRFPTRQTCVLSIAKTRPRTTET